MELVLDASVIIKWFLPESLAQKAIELRERHLKGEVVICATPLLAFEILNALSTKSGVENEAIKLAIEILYQTEIKEYSLKKELAFKAAQIAKKFKISFYDSSYVTLARQLKCRFLTADKNLYKKVKELKFIDHFNF